MANFKVYISSPVVFGKGCILEERSWPDGVPVPRIGDSVVTNGGYELVVKAIEWYPLGDSNGIEPFVFVILKDVK